MALALPQAMIAVAIAVSVASLGALPTITLGVVGVLVMQFGSCSSVDRSGEPR